MATLEELEAEFDAPVDDSSSLQELEDLFDSPIRPETATGGSPSAPVQQHQIPSELSREEYIKLWKPPTPEEETLQENYGDYMLPGVAGAAFRLSKGLPFLGRVVHSGTTALTTTAAELGLIKPLEEHAGRIHPLLKPVVGILGGVGSAVTIEALSNKWLINALTRTQPKFWTNQLYATKDHASIPAKFFDERRHMLARRADDGDEDAARILIKELYDEAHLNVKTKTETALAEEEFQAVAKKIAPESEEKVFQKMVNKKHLDDSDYEELAKLAEVNSINEFTDDFAKIKRSIINERATLEWNEHPMKETVDHIVSRGGMSEKVVRDTLSSKFTDMKINEIVARLEKRFPKLLVKNPTEDFLSVVRELEVDDIAKTLDDISNAPGLARITRTKQGLFGDEFNRIYRDEIFIRAQEKLSRYLGKIVGGGDIKLPPPGKAREGFTILGEAVKRVESSVPTGRVLEELVAVRKTVLDMANIIKRQTTNRLTTINKNKITKLRTEHAKKVRELKALHKIQRDTSRIHSRLKSVLQNSNMLGEYQEQVRNFLSPLFGGRGIKLTENMFQFLRRKYDDELSFGAGFVADKYDKMLGSLGTRPFRFKDLSYTQIKDIDDFVKSFSRIARDNKTIQLDAGRAYLDALGSNIKATAETAVPKLSMFRVKPSMTHLQELAKGRESTIGKFMEATSDLANGYLASLKRIEPILRQLDGFTNGLASKLIFEPIKQAEIMSHRLGDNVFDAYKTIFRTHQKGIIKGRRAAYWGKMHNAAGIEANKEAAIVMALNSKNKYNTKIMSIDLDKTPKEIKEFVDSALNPTDWKLVDDILNHLDNDIWPIMQKIYKENTGLTLQKAPGGRYYPIRSRDLKLDDQAKLADIMLTTNPKKLSEELEKSMFKTRTGGTESIHYTLDPLMKHLRDVVHTSTHWKALNDAQRLIKNNNFKDAVESTMGPKVYAQFQPWLDHLARPTAINQADPGLERILRHIRAGVTIGVLGLSPSTALKQTLSLITAIPKIGAKNVMMATTRFALQPIKTLQSVTEASPQMAYRIKTWQREIAELANTINPKDIGLLNKGVRNMFFKFIHITDRLTASMAWQAAYFDGLDKFSGNAHRAVDYADEIIRHTQPSSAAKDLPKIMRSGEGQRLITMFYSYFSVWHNQAAELINRGLAGNMSLPKVISTLMFISAAPIASWEVISAMGRGASDREDKGEPVDRILKGAGMMATSGLPVIRDVSAAALLGYDFKISPAADLGRALGDVGKGIVAAIDPDEEWEAKHSFAAMESVFYLTHMPSRQAVTFIKGAQRINEGQTDDWSELLIRKASKR